MSAPAPRACGREGCERPPVRLAGIGVARLGGGLCRAHAAEGRAAQGATLIRLGLAGVAAGGLAYLVTGDTTGGLWAAKGIASAGTFAALCGVALQREARTWAALPDENPFQQG